MVAARIDGTDSCGTGLNNSCQVQELFSALAPWSYLA